RRDSGVFAPEWIDACRADLAEASARVRPGTLMGAGRTIAELGNWAPAGASESARQSADRIAHDMAASVKSQSIDHLIVLNVARTEPPFVPGEVRNRWSTLRVALEGDSADLLPASALYAFAAFQHGHTYITFTPSLGASIPALLELARQNGSLYAGK